MSSLDHAYNRHRIETVESYSDIRLEVQRYIEEHYQERVGLTDFVRDKNVSQRQVQRALSWYSTTWQRMLLDVRMNRAKGLLAHSTETIGRVAEMVGYEHSQFSRTFRAEEGMGPEEYREWQTSDQSESESS